MDRKEKEIIGEEKHQVEGRGQERRGEEEA